ncbi:cytochrome c [Geobacter anodireducens]|uniref:Cytochrome C n=1 Tax=Geobacter soli TaxID=1510391 RepID=A0A0C1TU17_9BACT|nr:cytochrome c [Geobacter soli]KIE44264.1 cytochrome C [Geobacter soli]
MKRTTLLAACILALIHGGAFAHGEETHGKKHQDAQMDKFHKMMPMYAQVQAKINGALERKDAATVEAESEKILTTIPDLKKSTPHKNLKKIGTFREIADAFSAEVSATAALAKKGDIAGARTAFKDAGERCNECHAKFRD